jgi:hypothetical protein
LSVQDVFASRAGHRLGSSDAISIPSIARVPSTNSR